MVKNKHIWRNCIKEYDLKFLNALSLHLNKKQYTDLDNNGKDEIEDIYAIIVYVGQELKKNN